MLELFRVGGIIYLTLCCYVNELFRRVIQSSDLDVSSAELWTLLPALSGPANIVCPLQYHVKDTPVHNCAKLNVLVLYKGQAHFKKGLMALLSRYFLH
jgi:hypothetical protein